MFWKVCGVVAVVYGSVITLFCGFTCQGFSGISSAFFLPAVLGIFIVICGVVLCKEEFFHAKFAGKAKKTIERLQPQEKEPDPAKTIDYTICTGRHNKMRFDLLALVDLVTGGLGVPAVDDVFEFTVVFKDGHKTSIDASNRNIMWSELTSKCRNMRF